VGSTLPKDGNTPGVTSGFERVPAGCFEEARCLTAVAGGVEPAASPGAALGLGTRLFFRVFSTHS